MNVLKVRKSDGTFEPAYALSVDAVAMAGYEYSEDEKVVGCWIDGKPIYRKTVSFNNVACKHGSTFDMEVENIGDYRKIVDVILVDSENNYICNVDANGMNSDNASAYIGFRWSDISNSVLTQIGSPSWSASKNRTYRFIIEYTKTTDAENSFKVEMLGMKPFGITVNSGSIVEFALGSSYANKEVSLAFDDKTYTVTLGSDGTGTINSVTNIGSAVVTCGSESTTITIPSFSYYKLTSFIPDGETITPINSVSTWLECANMKDKSYTTIAEVLSDSTTLLALISNENACKYLVRSTEWATTMCNNSTAMTDIGNNDTCAEILLEDETWNKAICESSYFESVLNSKVPTMTSNTTPSGTASASSNDAEAYKAFDGNDSTFWASSVTQSGGNVTDVYSLVYKFDSEFMVNKLYLKTLDCTVRYLSLSISNDNSSWTKLFEETYESTTISDNEKTIAIPNNTKYYYVKVQYSAYHSGNGAFPTASTLQLYGRD